MAVKNSPFTGLVQFPHPGSEHDAKAFEGGVFPWNDGDHARKFLQTTGRWRTEDGAVGSGPLRFWGEYEPPSAVQAIGPKQGRLPRWVHAPLYPAASTGHRQNTDPLVLGGVYYSNCKQHRRRDRHSPSATYRMEPGSLILFGSKVDSTFVLDTLFVVADRQEYGREEVESLPVPEHVKDMALRPLYSRPDRDLRFVLYQGATVEQPLDGRWSFVPALPVLQPQDRFSRPRLVLPGVLNEALPMGMRCVDLPREQLADMWEQVLRQVYDADLVAATHLDVPAHQQGAAAGDTTGGRGRAC